MIRAEYTFSQKLFIIFKKVNKLKPNFERKHQIHNQSKFGLNSSKGYGLAADLKKMQISLHTCDVISSKL